MANGKCEENTAFNLKEIYGYMIGVLSFYLIMVMFKVAGGEKERHRGQPWGLK